MDVFTNQPIVPPPNELFGGQWTRIKDKFLLTAGDNYSAGSTGGEATHVLTTAETPAHTHTRGTMEILGQLFHNNTYSGSNVSGDGFTGAFYPIDLGGQDYYLNGRSTGSGWYDIGFQASRSWSGETSSVGGNASHNNMPPYLVVYCWYRIG